MGEVRNSSCTFRTAQEKFIRAQEKILDISTKVRIELKNAMELKN